MDYKFPPTMIGWTQAEILAWSPPDDLTVTQWANRHRILHPLSSAEPGPWRTDRTPYLAEIMDAFSDPTVEQISVMASTQVGKTSTIENMIAYVIDQDPGPALLVMPREEDCIQMGQRRLRPMIESSPQLTRHLSDQKTDNKLKEMRFSRSMLYLAGSNSPADLASRPIRFAFADECDKYPAYSGREADPISLVQERLRTFWNSKFVVTSTPTTREGYIYREYMRSDQRQYHVPCPHCNHSQTLEFPQVKWPEDQRDPAIIRQGRLAWYECIECGEQITDLDKPDMLRQGEWIAGVESAETASHRGYRLHCLYSPWLTFSEVAAKFLESKDDAASLLNFVNSWLGWIWEEQSEQIEADELEGRIQSYGRGIVPRGGIVLTAGVDVQKDHLFYSVHAHGLREESWLVECGRLDAGLEQLAPVLVNRVFEGEGQNHRIRLVCIDAGYRTDEVYRFARHHAEIVRPVKGQQSINGVPIRTSKIDRTASGDPVKRSIRLWHLDTGHFKDKLARMLTAQDGEHGAFHTHADTPAEYLRHLASEHKILQRNRNTGNTKSIWTGKPGGGPNHWLDSTVYAFAAADMLQVFALTEAPPQSPEQEHTAQRTSSWVSRGKGWLDG